MWICRVVELEAATLGEHLAQHPYDRAMILNAGVKVSGDRHEYLIPFNQLLTVHCKCGLVWGELELVPPDGKMVRLHGTEWDETQRLYHHLDARWRRWNGGISETTSGVLRQQLDLVAIRTGENKWLTYEQTSGVQQQIRQAVSVLPLPIDRLEESGSCREAWRKCQAWLKDIESIRLQHSQTYTEAVPTKYADFFCQVESSLLNPVQARAVVDSEYSLLVLAGTGSGEMSVLVACAGWLLAHGETSPEQILSLVFGRKTAEEMDKRTREQLHTGDITVRTLHALALHIIQQDSKKVLVVSKLEDGTATRHELFIAEWRKQYGEEKAQARGWRQ